MVQGDLISDGAVSIRPKDLGFGRLFPAIRDAVVVGDARTGRIVLWNPAAERLFGYSVSEAVGMPLESLVPERLRDRHRDGIAAYASTGHGSLIAAAEPVDVPALRKDGTEVAVELSLSPIADGPPQAYVVAVIRDATARQRLAAERETVLASAQDYAARLEELAELRSTFTSMVAHELGAPLAAIGGLADLLIGGAVPVDQRPALAVAIRAETDLLRRLVADVQAASVMERDDFTVQLRPVPAATLLADAAAFARLLPGEHPVTSELETAAVASRVLADPARIGQVMRNLLGNAAKHTPPGTPVAIRARCNGPRLLIEVADEGPGIAPHDLKRIFEKFGRGRDAEGNKVPGVGLGLYLARRIIAAHGSELTVRSSPNAGAVLGFDLEVVS